MTLNKTALAIRPYGNHVRGLVFNALSAAGIEVQAPEPLLSATNEEIVQLVQAYRADILLIPFNVVRFGKDARTNGLELLGLLRERVSWTRNLMTIMPVSVFARAAFQGTIANHPTLNLYILNEDELGSPDLPKKLAQFCGHTPPGNLIMSRR